MNDENTNGVFKDRVAPLRNFVTLIFKRHKIILLVFFSVVLSATVVTLLMTPVFEASSKILVERKDNAEKAFLFGMNLPRNYETYDWIKSEIEIMKSHPVASRVVKELILKQVMQENKKSTGEKNGELFEREVENFQTKLSVVNARNSNVINVSYKAKDPLLVASIVDRVIETYRIYRSEIYKEFDTYKFFEEQMDITDKKLRELEQSQATYKHQEEMISPEVQGEILLSRLADYEKSLTAVRTKRIGNQAKLDVIKQQLKLGSEINIPSTEVSEGRSREQYISKLKGELLDKKIQRKQLLQRFKPTYGEIVDLERDIDATQEQIKREVMDIIKQEETSIQALHAEEQALQKSIDEINQQIKKLAQKEYELTQLSRGIDDNREVYSILLKQREEARISLAKMQSGVKIKIISPAIVPSDPVSPKKRLNVVLAAMLGVTLGIGLAFLVEHSDRSISTGKDVRKFTGLNVLGSVKEHDEVG